MLSYIYHLGLQLLSLGAATGSGCITGSHTLDEDPCAPFAPNTGKTGVLTEILSPPPAMPRLSWWSHQKNCVLTSSVPGDLLWTLQFSRKYVNIFFCLKTFLQFSDLKSTFKTAFFFVPQNKQGESKYDVSHLNLHCNDWS